MVFCCCSKDQPNVREEIVHVQQTTPQRRKPVYRIDQEDPILLTNQITSYVSLGSPRKTGGSDSGMKLPSMYSPPNKNINGQVHFSNVTCYEGHPVRFLPKGYRKLRRDARGVVSQPMFSSFQCQSCLNQTVLGPRGYYSCEEKCHFDLCLVCMTCQIDGQLLCESYSLPSQDTIKWQQFCNRDTQENYFDQSTNSTATEINTGGMSQRAMPRRDAATAQLRSEKKLFAQCSRCLRTMLDEELTTTGYLNCVNCQNFTCRNCVPKPILQ